jgi:hypothetical protein
MIADGLMMWIELLATESVPELDVMIHDVCAPFGVVRVMWTPAGGAVLETANVAPPRPQGFVPLAGTT